METFHRPNMENPNSSMKMQQPEQNRSLQANATLPSCLTFRIVVETRIHRSETLLACTSYQENHATRHRRFVRKTKTGTSALNNE
jgi:hypothetical protein